MQTQTCPNCHFTHDIGVYVTGQKILCRCGINFEVKRTDVTATSAETHEVNGSPQHDKTFISSKPTIAIPGYDLMEVLGRGGMGEVWRARQRSLGREVAVKILPPHHAKDRESIGRFEREAKALASLNHPNIVQIIDRGVTGEHYFFVMEYVQGQSLRELLNDRRLSPVEVVKLALQICQAIDYAHEKQIIHRDLKPENILVDERRQVKVADFGLAGIGNTEPGLHLTATAVAMGTINYMAPEQRRDAKNVDHRADLYSLGVILYELLTGELPLGRFKLPSERSNAIDRRLDSVVVKALESDPALRYARASLIAADLEQLISTPSVSTPSITIDGADRSSPRPAPGPSADSSPKALLRTGWRGLRVALMAVGALVVAGVVVRWMFGPISVEVAKGDGKALVIGASGAELLHLKEHGHLAAGKYPPNTNGSLFVESKSKESNGLLEVSITFGPGKEELRAYAGTWKLEDGRLKATQGGSDTGGQKLIPRAYLDQRYFSSDDVTAEVEMTFRDLESDFPTEENAQHFGELSFRSKDLQISAFAIDDQVIRLLWRYLSAAGREIAGNSARDWETLVENEMPIPPDGTPFRVRLSLKRHAGGTEVEGFLNGDRFARQVLAGLHDQTGRLSLGCRNLHCDFRNLSVRGKPASVPQEVMKVASEKPE